MDNENGKRDYLKIEHNNVHTLSLIAKDESIALFVMVVL